MCNVLVCLRAGRAEAMFRLGRRKVGGGNRRMAGLSSLMGMGRRAGRAEAMFRLDRRKVAAGEGVLRHRVVEDCDE